MPAPGKKGKSKPRPKPKPSSASTFANGFFDNIDDAMGWEMVVDTLCELFQLPDLSTRSGLKKVHANFELIHKRLDDAYTKQSDNPKITGGIVGIYAKMCADSILRDKLFKAGLLSKIMPLLYVPECRHVALRALSTITHHGGAEARTEIAKKTPALIDLIHEHENDPKVAELSLVTMSHAIAAVVANEDKPDPTILKKLDMPSVLWVTTAQLRKPTASSYLRAHAARLISEAPQHCWKDYKAYPAALTYLVASLRSKELIIRCEAVAGLLRYHIAQCEQDQRQYDPMKIMAAVQSTVPPYLCDVMIDYGTQRCDLYMTLSCTGEHKRAMMKLMQDHDYKSLGKTVARLITSTEFSLTQGEFRAEDPRTGKPMDTGLPFVNWLDALPLCAKALRTTGISSDLDDADIIDCKYLVFKARHLDAITLAKKAMQRSPENAYFYYVVTLGKDRAEGLRYAKKGVKCKKITPFIRWALLHRAVDHAGDMGINFLDESKGYRHAKPEEAVAFLKSAYEDAKAYIDGAPPDSRHMKNMINWYLVLALVIRGPAVSENLSEYSTTCLKISNGQKTAAPS